MSTADAERASLTIDELIAPAITPEGHPSSRDSVRRAGAGQGVLLTASEAASRAPRGTRRGETREPFHIHVPFGASVDSSRSEWSSHLSNGRGAQRAQPRLASRTTGTARALGLLPFCGEARAWCPRCRIDRPCSAEALDSRTGRGQLPRNVTRRNLRVPLIYTDRATRHLHTMGPAKALVSLSLPPGETRALFPLSDREGLAPASLHHANRSQRQC